MNELEIFNQFGKGELVKTARTGNCVIYTRVSTKEQADNNMSLTTQKKACINFAEKNKFSILGEFGGTYESAKNDERKEFNRMLSFVKKSKEKISYIIVYSVDRFSRSGANAIYIKEQLRNQGIHILAVTQPTDSESASGSLQQNIQFIFSEYDNQVRREKCIAGTREALLRGEWIQATPWGYDSVRVNNKRIMTINKKGEILRKAFEWKAQGVTSTEIMERMAKLGAKIPKQTLSHALHNPFYCGLMSHNALEGKVVQGTHPPLISKELFLKVHGIMTKDRSGGYKCKMENEALPLKNFLRCDHCGCRVPGYIVKKKNLWYYKCRTKGCGNNVSAKKLHQRFENILQSFAISSEQWEQLIGEEFKGIYRKLNAEKESQASILRRRISEVQVKLDRLEERFVMEEISAEQYAKFQAKLKEEKAGIEKELQTSAQTVSNLEIAVKNLTNFARNISVYWGSAGYYEKVQLQYLMFPEGISYSKKTDECRTKKIDPALLTIALLSQSLGNKKVGIPDLNISYSDLVPGAGIEPALTFRSTGF
jgi:site-specific DNA recombinase